LRSTIINAAAPPGVDITTGTLLYRGDNRLIFNV
jgi:hypothetical protein